MWALSHWVRLLGHPDCTHAVTRCEWKSLDFPRSAFLGALSCTLLLYQSRRANDGLLSSWELRAASRVLVSKLKTHPYSTDVA